MMNKMEIMNMDKKMIETDLMYVENQLNELKRFLAKDNASVIMIEDIILHVKAIMEEDL